MAKWTVTIPVLQYDVYAVETNLEFADECEFKQWFWNTYMMRDDIVDPVTLGGDSCEEITYEMED